jgi:hypothetical protein
MCRFDTRPPSFLKIGKGYNWRVDVFITPEAGREIEALKALRPAPSTWGVLVGHKRGPRVIVEKVFPAGDGAPPLDEAGAAELERIWPGGVVGVFAVRPGAAFRKAVLAPLFYGKIVLVLDATRRSVSISPAVVDFDRKFYLAPAGLAPAVKGRRP